MFKVSVVLTVYNTSKYLSQCLGSIIKQTLRDIEVICVNDGSTDDSLSILDKYAAQDNRVKVVSKANERLGGASARNLGLTLAEGQYVCILDSDDFFEPDMLGKMVNRAEETNADIILCGGVEYDDNSGHATKVPSILDENYIPQKSVFSYRDCEKSIYQLSQGMAWNKLYRLEFLHKHNLRFQKIKYTDDAYFTFAHMVLAEKIAIVNEPLVYYRVRTGQSQTDGLARYPESAYLPYAALKKSLTDWGIYESVKQSFVNCAAKFLRYFYDKIDVFEVFNFIHEKYKKEIFQELDICGHSKEYFYDDRVYEWQKQVCEYSAGELAFMVARSFGRDNTTMALRFTVPYHLIPRGSRIVILGAGLMGRYYYSQIILSAFCDVVLFCDNEYIGEFSYINNKSLIQNADFDLVLIAYVQPQLIKNAIDYLDAVGVPNKKIILGGGDL